MSSGCRLAGTLETTAISSREGVLHPETWPTHNCSEDQADECCSQEGTAVIAKICLISYCLLSPFSQYILCLVTVLTYFFVSFKMYRIGKEANENGKSPPSVCETECHSKAHTMLNSKYSPMNSKQSSCFCLPNSWIQQLPLINLF